MSKSSLEYTEMAGLSQAMVRLRCVPITDQDEDWTVITGWMNKRIDELAKK
jgi:hypothetical protein